MAPEAIEPTLVADLPAAFSASADDSGYAPAAWWHEFDDPILNGLVDRALRNNLDVAEAAGRLEQASAQARIARSALLPTIDVSANTNFSTTPVDGLAFGDIAGGGIDRIENENYTTSLGASYELDLFGRARDDFRAAGQDAVGAAHDLRTVQLTSAAETISAYFDLVDTVRQLELTRLTSDVLFDREARSDERYQRGLIESFELYQVRQDLRATQASIPQFESDLAAIKSRLALLIGTYPNDLDATLSTTLQPRLVFDEIPAGLPINLLEQRPDIAAAWARLEAARLRIGARRAERFPRLTLSGTFGAQGGDAGAAFNLANNWASTLASSIVAPLLDGGRISANIRSARAVYDQNAAAYARMVIGAFGEVESALADYQKQRERYLLITGQLDAARASFALQSRRFEAGISNYTDYLDALRNLYQVELSLSSAARATALARLDVHRALGGDWAPNVEPQPLKTQQTEQAQSPEGGRQ